MSRFAVVAVIAVMVYGLVKLLLASPAWVVVILAVGVGFAVVIADLEASSSNLEALESYRKMWAASKKPRM